VADPRLRVALPTPLSVDCLTHGGGRHLVTLAHALVAASDGAVEVDLIACAAQRSRVRLAQGLWLRGLPWPSSGARNGASSAIELAEAIEAADVVHVQGVFTRLGETALLAARLLGRPVCVSDGGGRPSPVGRRLGILDLADTVVVWSRREAAALDTSTPVVVVPGGADTLFFTPGDGSSPRDTMVFVGRPPARLAESLVAGWPCEVRRVLVTALDDDGGGGTALSTPTRDGPVVTVDGDVRETSRSVYRRALAVVQMPGDGDPDHTSPSDCGTGVLTMLEGMACGAPVVCMRAAAISEYVEDGVTGLVAADGAAWTAHVATVVEDQDRARRMGILARREVDRRWDMATAGRHLLAVYRRLVGR